MPKAPFQRFFPLGEGDPLPAQARTLPLPLGALGLLLLLALLGGCQGDPSLAQKGRERCSAQVEREANGLLRPLRYGKCLLSIGAVLERERAEAQIRQQAAARKRLAECYANQAEVKSLVLALKAAKGRLAKLQADAYVESERPRRLDPDLQSRFAPYDQELDQERYDQALAQWHQAESQRYRGWQAARQQAISEEQAHQASLVRRLNQINPDLFAAPGSLGPPPVFNPQAYGQALACQPEPLR